jgi:hypothetical protein
MSESDSSFCVRVVAEVSEAWSSRTVIVVVVSSRTDLYDDVVDVTSLLSVLDTVEIHKLLSQSSLSF